MKNNDLIQTNSGIMFNLTDPKPEMVVIDDIAHALARICRFNGHTRGLYSVAQHSVLCCWKMAATFEPAHQSLASGLLACQHALMHDSHEAYTGDLSSPLKRLLPKILIIQERIQRVILAALKVERDKAIEKSVKNIDRRMLWTERRDLLAEVCDWPAQAVQPYEEKIETLWVPEVAELAFRSVWKSLAGGGAFGRSTNPLLCLLPQPRACIDSMAKPSEYLGDGVFASVEDAGILQRCETAIEVLEGKP